MKIQDSQPSDTLRSDKTARVSPKTQKLFEQFSATLADVLLQLAAVQESQESVVQAPKAVAPEKTDRSAEEQKMPGGVGTAGDSAAAGGPEGADSARLSTAAAGQGAQPQKTEAEKGDGRGEPDAPREPLTAGRHEEASQAVSREAAVAEPAVGAAATAVSETEVGAAAGDTSAEGDAAAPQNAAPSVGDGQEGEVTKAPLLKNHHGKEHATQTRNHSSEAQPAPDQTAAADTTDVAATAQQSNASDAAQLRQGAKTDDGAADRFYSEITQRLQNGSASAIAHTAVPGAVREVSAESDHGVQLSQRVVQAEAVKGISQTASSANTPQFPAFTQGQHEKRSEHADQAGRTRPQELPRMTRLFEKVEEALKEVARSKDGKTISVILEPQALGTVKVDVSLRDGVLHARLVAENPQVAQLLRDRAGELQEVLRNMGLQADRVSVSVGGEGTMSSFDGMLDSSSQHRQPPGSRTSYGIEDTGARGAAVSTPAAQPAVVDHWVA